MIALPFYKNWITRPVFLVFGLLPGKSEVPSPCRFPVWGAAFHLRLVLDYSDRRSFYE
jgi:hypothetical protein